MSRRSVTIAAMAVALAALAGMPAVASAGSPARCDGPLPVAIRLPTSTARALSRLGFVRVVASAPVRDLRVALEHGGRLVAQGTRKEAFSGSRALRLELRRPARAGRASLVATGRRTGCAAKRTVRRAVTLDRRDLPVALSAAESDLRDGRFAIGVRRTDAQPVSELRVRVLDGRGRTVAEQAHDELLGEPLRMELKPRERLAAGRYWVLATATVRGEGARAAAAATIDLGGDRVPVVDAPDDAPPGPPPARGAVVQTATVSWSGGRWEGADRAGFALPGIGEGQLVCSPDTQWIRVFPSDRSRDVAMMLWTFRDWEGGSEGALREAQMTPFTGPDFNEGMNKFTPSEKRSNGTFTGVVGDGLPTAGTFGVGRAPTEVRLSWSWDFEDPAGARCAIAATFVSEGAGSEGPVARGLSLAWNGESGVPAQAVATTPVPGLGTVLLRCDPRPEGVRQLILDPAAPLPGLTLTSREGSDVVTRALGDVPYVVELPNNGLVELQTPGGAPGRVLLASRWKVNDPDPAQSSCRLWGLAVAG
jgi:hypothetical protein